MIVSRGGLSLERVGGAPLVALDMEESSVGLDEGGEAAPQDHRRGDQGQALRDPLRGQEGLINRDLQGSRAGTPPTCGSGESGVDQCWRPSLLLVAAKGDGC